MLEIKGVNSFYGKAHVLNDLSFDVARGQVVALLGRNGAGKTTTMKSVMQLVVPPRSPDCSHIKWRRWVLAMCLKSGAFLPTLR